MGIMCKAIVINLVIVSGFVAISTAQGNVTYPQPGIGPCICDLTNKVCDIGCCCDQDCTSSDLASFRSSCISFSFENIQTCLPSRLFYRYTAPNDVNTTNSDQTCFYKNDFASRNNYTAPVLITTEANAVKVIRAYAQYALPVIFYLHVNLNSLNNYYKSGGHIFIYFPINTYGKFSLPSVQDSGACGGHLPVEYLINRAVSCSRSVNSLQETCQNQAYVNAGNYVSSFKILSNPVVFKSLLNRTDNGTYNYTESPYDVTGMLLIDLNVSCSTGNICNSTSLVPEYNGTTKECSNVLNSIAYTFEYDGINGITSVKADLLLGTITQSFQQSFSIKFVQKNATNPLPKSGNPGYLIGKPILAGKLKTDSSNKQVIEVNSDPNNRLTAVSGRECGITSSRTAVMFGYSMSSGCMVSFQQNISAQCSSLETTIIQSLNGNGGLPDRIAMFGNSLATNPDDWIPVITTGLDGRPTSFPSGCSQIIIGAQLSIIWARVGSLTNPQNRIIGAEIKYIRGDIKYLCQKSACLNNAVQKYPISMTVTFIDTSVTGGVQGPTDAASLGAFKNDILYIFHTDT